MDKKLKELMASYIPMSEQSFIILLSLTSPRHGYALMTDVKEKSGGRIDLGPSTVYTVLGRMEKDGLIEVTEKMKKKKVYVITDTGRLLLECEIKRLKGLCKIAKKLLNETK